MAELIRVWESKYPGPHECRLSLEKGFKEGPRGGTVLAWKAGLEGSLCSNHAPQTVFTIELM